MMPLTESPLAQVFMSQIYLRVLNHRTVTQLILHLSNTPTQLSVCTSVCLSVSRQLNLTETLRQDLFFYFTNYL